MTKINYTCPKCGCSTIIDREEELLKVGSEYYSFCAGCGSHVIVSLHIEIAPDFEAGK